MAPWSAALVTARGSRLGKEERLGGGGGGGFLTDTKHRAGNPWGVSSLPTGFRRPATRSRVCSSLRGARAPPMLTSEAPCIGRLRGGAARAQGRCPGKDNVREQPPCMQVACPCSTVVPPVGSWPGVMYRLYRSAEEHHNSGTAEGGSFGWRGKARGVREQGYAALRCGVKQGATWVWWGGKNVGWNKGDIQQRKNGHVRGVGWLTGGCGAQGSLSYRRVRTQEGGTCTLS